MADDQQTPSFDTTREMPQGGNLPIAIHAQYVKDLSFENPNTPESLRGGKAMPVMDVNIGMDARKIADDKIPFLYEVVLNVRAEAKRDDKVVFIAELQYGVTASLNDMPEESHHPVLLIEIPRLAFPYARQILSDMTVQGGYPPLLLNPVDFQALYMDRFKDEIEKARAEAAAGAA
ncbi:MAG TPA: protein-export chaperone SecB [Alphaproteobacteria bacterium]|nr:protein-export chaperone SecB [Alphaproteobacteria bacterium]